MLAPNDDLATEFLAAFADGYLSMNAAAITVRETHVPPMDPPPAWLPPLQALVDEATGIAEEWLTARGPDLVATLPQTFITYSRHYDAVTAGFDDLSVDDATSQLQSLHAAAQRAATTVATHEAHAKETSDALSACRAKVEAAVTDAGASLAEERAAAEKVMTSIASLEAQVSDAVDTVKGDPKNSALEGKDLTIAVLELAIAAEATAFGGLSIVIAIGALIYTGIQTAMENAEIVKKLGELRDLYVELTVDAQRIAAMQTIVTALQGVDASLLALRNQLAVAPLWTTVADDVQEVIVDMPAARDFHELAAIKALAASGATWRDLAAKATNVQSSTTGINVVHIAVSPLLSAT